MIFNMFCFWLRDAMDPYQQMEAAQQGYFIFPVSGAWVGRPIWMPRQCAKPDLESLPPEEFPELEKADDGLFHMLWRLHWLWLQMGDAALRSGDAGAIAATRMPPPMLFPDEVPEPRPAASQPPMEAETHATSEAPSPAPSKPRVVPPRMDMPPPPPPDKRKKRPRSPIHSPPWHLKAKKSKSKNDCIGR